jgi:ATP-dependent helicase/nuclease subunit A
MNTDISTPPPAPKTGGRPLDPKQDAAYRADNNAVVSAGAGSGKTTVLAKRYVRLVTERGLKVNEVLTLTFTRKAAAEMRGRIFNQLRDEAETNDKAKEALAQFDKARISTLDSFCSALVRGASYRYGVAGDFSVDDNALSAIARETAMELIMRERDNPTVRRLVSSRSFEAVVNDLFAALAVNHFSLVRHDDYAELARKQVARVEAETKTCIEFINDCCERILSLDDAKSKSETLVKAKAAARRGVPCPARAPDTPDGGGFAPAYVELLAERGAFFAGSESFALPRASAKDPALSALREIAAGDADEPGLKACAKKLEMLAKTLRFREDILAAGALLADYKDRFVQKKRQAGLLTFGDTLEMAVDVLLNDLSLRNFYKRHIQAVMIDEFQDNNEMQKRLLYLISEKEGAGAVGVMTEPRDLNPKKLFFVGDEKQSIYRFRGADVAVFMRLSRELGNETVPLDTNYRSTPELVSFFNALFPGVFKAGDDGAKKDGVRFSRVQHNPKKPQRGHLPG